MTPPPDNAALAATSVGNDPARENTGRRLVVECRRLVERRLAADLDGFKSAIDDTLFELAAKTGSNDFQAAFYDALRDVRRHWEPISGEMIKGVLGSYDRFWQDAADVGLRAAVDADSLELIQEEELEEKLALSSMVTKAENRFFRDLALLGRRLGHLAGHAESSDIANPLGPKYACESFSHAVRPVVPDLSLRLVLYRLFDRTVVGKLDDLYQEVNRFLEEGGILPGLRPGALLRKNPEGERQTASRNAGEPETDEATGAHAATFDRLRHLFQQRRRMGHRSGRALPPVRQEDLLEALSSMQERNLAKTSFGSVNMAAAQAHDVGKGLLRRLKMNGDARDRKEIGAVDQDAIDIITMLFEFILGDGNIPDEMKVLLVRLQIPLLKVAIMDRSFFDNSDHPARALLNNLASAAARWTDDGDRSKASLYGRIESLVNRILMEFDHDPVIFRILNEELADYLQKELRGSRVAEERTAQTLRGKEKLQVLKNRVFREIGRRLRARRDIPPVVREILQGPWKDVLLLTGLQKGTDGTEWNLAVALMDRLLWSVDLRTGTHARQDLLRAIPQIVRELREGMNYISFDANQMAQLIKELQTLHIACVRGVMPGNGALPVVNDANLPVVEDLSVTQITQGDPYAKRAYLLPVGSWLEITDVDNKRRRIKLCWKSEVSDAFYFVDRKGVQVAEMTLAEVADLFRGGRADTLQELDVPMVDRALAYMMKTMDEKAAKPAQG